MTDQIEWFFIAQIYDNDPYFMKNKVIIRKSWVRLFGNKITTKYLQPPFNENKL